MPFNGYLKGEMIMLPYLASLALGLIGVYALRDGLLILQTRRDEKARKMNAAQTSGYIIPNNSEHCKRFERAS